MINNLVDIFIIIIILLLCTFFMVPILIVDTYFGIQGSELSRCLRAKAKESR